ncbi:hypothetical protein TIFTF001_010007 [Ficus carica]|uniref:Uncharacterized protein n=1 Tax=Ficus carica TaxID=3494 RepID=A0AA87ZP83_FICCA|nr:hypothetical protein TIFTF001_010007 [Ficus carica]
MTEIVQSKWKKAGWSNNGGGARWLRTLGPEEQRGIGLGLARVRLLKIFCCDELNKCKVGIPPGDDDLQFLPDLLVYLHWDGYPWKSFPSSFRPQYLVELNLPYSKVNKLWKGSLHLGSLKKIDLGYSENLIMLPILSKARKLERIYLDYCSSLQEVPSYFQDLHELKTLFLEGCSSVREFPKVSKCIECLVLSRPSIEQVPSTIQDLSCISRS